MKEDKKRYLDAFKRLLKDEDAWAPYFHHLICCNEGYPQGDLLDRVLPCMWLSCGFRWSFTEEGEYFWRHLDNKWQSIITSFNHDKRRNKGIQGVHGIEWGVG